MIQWWTRSGYNHCGLIIIIEDSPYVAEFSHCGGRLVPLADVLKKYLPAGSADDRVDIYCSEAINRTAILPAVLELMFTHRCPMFPIYTRLKAFWNRMSPFYSAKRTECPLNLRSSLSGSTPVAYVLAKAGLNICPRNHIGFVTPVDIVSSDTVRLIMAFNRDNLH
jgi:hypothetical protein